MTVAVPVGDLPYTAAQPLPIGSLVYLASYAIRMALKAETTGPDTPNLYSAELEVMGDQGDMNLNPLVGPQGFPGRHQFPLRRQVDPTVDEAADLPTDLTDTPDDIGKYWILNDLDEWGNIVSQECHIWWGSDWRVLLMGSYGIAGPPPDIQPHVHLIEPQTPPTYPDTSSWVDTSGTTLQPSWVFNLAVPAGAPGEITYLYDFPDVDMSTPPALYDLLGATNLYTEDGLTIWKPRSVKQYLPGAFSMPESAFSAYTGMSQRAAIGSYVIPPQPFPWTAVVWGHIGGGGAMLSGHPLMIGCEVLLGDPVNGKLIGRGLGNTLGEVNVMPHYSSSQDMTAAMTPTNRRALVPANHTSAAQGTVYVNLWNDGALGAYDFQPHGAQLFLMVVPMLEEPRR